MGDIDDELINACENNDINAVKKFIEAGANVDNEDGEEAPLIIASSNGNLEIVKYLIDAGADVNIKSYNKGESALMVASREQYPEIVEFLLQNGANLYLKDDDLGETAWDTAYFYAGEKEEYAIRLFNLFCKYGYNVESYDPEGRTALMNASEKGS